MKTKKENLVVKVVVAFKEGYKKGYNNYINRKAIEQEVKIQKFIKSVTATTEELTVVREAGF